MGASQNQNNLKAETKVTTRDRDQRFKDLNSQRQKARGRKGIGNSDEDSEEDMGPNLGKFQEKQHLKYGRQYKHIPDELH